MCFLVGEKICFSSALTRELEFENWTMAQSYTSDSDPREDPTSKWPDVMKNSKQIAAGFIQKYMLITVKEHLNKDGLVRKCTFGKKDPDKRNRTILMVGAAGTGKSTLVNMMVNNMLGVKWEDNIRFEIIPNEDKDPQIGFQTTAIIVYEIYGLEDLSVPFSLTVIDTPGFTDPRALEKDKRIARNLYRFLNSGSSVKQIDAVCLVVKASLNRLNPTQKYIFDAILSLFGKNMEKNIMTLITFSSWVAPVNALEAVIESGVPFTKDKNNEHVYFSFNNLRLQKPEKNEKQYKTSWDNGADSFSEFFQALDKMETQSLEMTRNVLKERQSLEASLDSLESQLEKEETKRKELQEAQKTLEELSEEMRKNFEDKNTEEVNQLIPEENPPCSLRCFCSAWYWLWNHLCAFFSLLVRLCCSCRKQGYKKHQNDSEKHEPQNEANNVSHEDQKNEVEGKIAAAKADISKHELELNAIEAEKIKLIEQAYQCIIQLKEFALKFDSDSTCQNIHRLIEILKNNNMAEKVEELQMMLGKTVCR